MQIASRFIEEKKIIKMFEVEDYGKRSAVIDKRFKFCKFNYIPRLFESIRHTLFKYDVKLIAAPPPKLKDLLNTKIDPVQAINRSGVYIIAFQKDSKYFIYVGMTMRKLPDRIKEHEGGLRLNRPHTELSRLTQTQAIKVEFNKSKIIFRKNNYQEAIIRESIEIIANKDTACNDALSYYIHGVWIYLLHNI